MRTLPPRNGFRLKALCTQTPFPDGSTTPGPGQLTVEAGVTAVGWPQCDQAPCGLQIVSCTPRGAGGAVPVSVGVSRHWTPFALELQACTLWS